MKRFGYFLTKNSKKLEVKVELSPLQLSNLKRCLLSIYEDVFRVCDKYGLCLMLTGGSALGAVVVVVDGDKPHSHEGQYLFQKVSGFQEVAPKPGQVFHDDAVHPACFHILHHPLESRALK